MVQELRQHADEQPDKEKILWKRHLSQQADYRAEIHELHTELLNMRERSEMKGHLAANMCRIEQTVPSRTVDAEPDNTLNTLSPGRSSRWILPHELETPDRPTSSGLQSPVGVPVQFGPSPMTREYSATPPAHVPPAQWLGMSQPGWEDLGWENASYCPLYQVILFDWMACLNNACNHCKLQLEEIMLASGCHDKYVRPRSFSTANSTRGGKLLPQWSEAVV